MIKVRKKDILSNDVLIKQKYGDDNYKYHTECLCGRYNYFSSKKYSYCDRYAVKCPNCKKVTELLERSYYLMECPYCNKELNCVDYYGYTRYSEHYWIYPHSWIEKEGDIFQCDNEECQSQCFSGYFYDKNDEYLIEGYPC